eukprot:SM000057S18340  [mRNA]  locus=s57:79350:81521:- [translate_table: standard]
MTAFFKNRIVFVGQAVNAAVAQRVISQLLSLAAIDDSQDIKVRTPLAATATRISGPDGAVVLAKRYMAGSISSFCACSLAAWRYGRPIIGAEMAELLRQAQRRQDRMYINCPGGSTYSILAIYDCMAWDRDAQHCWILEGTVDDVRRQVNEVMSSRDKIDKMYAAFTGQPLERVQKFTERDRFFSSAEAQEFGLIDGIIETEY